MTKHSEHKQVAAMALCTALSNFAHSFALPITFFTFANQEDLWRLNTLDPLNNTRGLLRVADALHLGDRLGSDPLDAAISIQNAFHDREELQWRER